ncbi:MAG: hypothetical protein JST00_00670 [Deltaproteobacteria bacterium]|nr:hypothetical protein [Deltaproteobacteria bacterium]
MNTQARIEEAWAEGRGPSEGRAAAWNAVRCPSAGDGAAGHVESYFLKLVDPEGRRALWLKATILVHEGGAPRVAEAWAVTFDRDGRPFAVKHTSPLDQASFSRDGLDVRVGDLRITPGHVWGRVESAGRMVACDLRFTMGTAPLVPFPSERMYETKLPSSKLVSPHPDSTFTGSYTTSSGDEVLVRGWRGMQGHNWGARHAELYAWGHCNQWDGGEDDLVLEAVTARVRVGPVLAPPLTVVCVRHRGVRYDFNAPLELIRARGTLVCPSERAPSESARWSFSAKSSIATVTGEMWAEPRDFAGLGYENPDGAMTHCLNSKLARARLRLSVKGRSDVETMTRAAAFEIGTRDHGHGIAILA